MPIGALAELINARLADLGKQQRDLAADLDVDEATVSRWCNGVQKPRNALIPSLAAALETAEPIVWEAFSSDLSGDLKTSQSEVRQLSRTLKEAVKEMQAATAALREATSELHSR